MALPRPAKLTAKSIRKEIRRLAEDDAMVAYATIRGVMLGEKFDVKPSEQFAAAKTILRLAGADRQESEESAPGDGAARDLTTDELLAELEDRSAQS